MSPWEHTPSSPAVSPVSPAVSVPFQVSFSAGGRGAQEDCFSVSAQRIFSFVSSFVLYWWASTRGGVSAANETTEIIQVIQRLHPTPGSGRSVGYTHANTHMHTHTKSSLSDWFLSFQCRLVDLSGALKYEGAEFDSCLLEDIAKGVVLPDDQDMEPTNGPANLPVVPPTHLSAMTPGTLTVIRVDY